MENKLDKILDELILMKDDVSFLKCDLKAIKDDLKTAKEDIKVIKDSQLEIRSIVSSIKEAQEITSARSTALENIQERQQLLIETLSYRSIQQETDIRDLKRMIQNQ
jgi:hypothetical protein